MVARTWTEGLRVTLLTPILTDAQGAEAAAQRLERIAEVAAAARALGWDPSSRVVAHSLAVPRAFLEEVAALSGLPKGTARAVSGVELASPDASDADADAAARAFATALLVTVQDRFGVRAGVPLAPPPGYEHTRDLREVFDDLLARGVVSATDDAQSKGFLAALRASLSAASWSAASPFAS